MSVAKPKTPPKLKTNAGKAAKPAKPAPSPRPSVLGNGRQLKMARYKSFRLQKHVKIARPALPSAMKLLRQSFSIIFKNWKLLFGVVAIYGVLDLLIVQGLGGLNVAQTKATLAQTGHYSDFTSGLTAFGYLLGSSNAAVGSDGSVSASPIGSGPYQLVLIVMASLAIIWALRQLYAKVKIRVRDAYYQGMTPVIPFVLVLCVIGLQLTPLLIGALLYNVVMANGIAVLAFEKMMWVAVLAFCALISLYMVCSSVFALYIVTLPDMTPMKALRTARQLVYNRRWTIMRKVLFLPLALLLILAAIIVPLIMFAAPVAAWIFLPLGMLAIAAVHSYIYALYRALL